MATNSHCGYPLKWFEDQNLARNSFACVFCLEVLKNPVKVRGCRHQFCALCIDDILKTNRHCPSCRKKISKTKVFKDYAARHLIKKLHVNCWNEGCNWVGKLCSLLKSHMNSCNFLVSKGNENIVKHLDAIKLETKCKTPVPPMLNVSTSEEMRDEEVFLRTYIKLQPTHLQILEKLRRNPIVTVALKIRNFTRKLRLARSSKRYGRIDSEPFYTYRGYRMKISAYLNEGPRRPRGYKGYMGIYLSLMQGDHDDSLKWPFDKRVTFIVVDQQDSLSQVNNFEITMIPEGQKEFNRPLVGNNGGIGNPQFMRHSDLRTREYVRNHTLYIAVAIEA